MFIVIGCNKETTVIDNSGENAVSLRSAEALDVNWLIDFQTTLRDLRDYGAASKPASYTNEDVRYGLEVLLNVKYSRAFADDETSFIKEDITFDSSIENYYDLYKKIDDAFIAKMSSNDNTVGVNIELDKVEGNVSYYIATLILSGSGKCQAPSSCDYFDANESYYLGMGEIWPEGVHPDLDCSGKDPCGGVDQNNEIITTALTEVQNKLNCLNYEEYCPPIEGASVLPVNFYNTDYKTHSEELWDKLNKSPYRTEQCVEYSLYGGLKPCDCLDVDKLNSLTEVLRSFIEDEIDKIRIKAYNQGKEYDYRLIAVNIGTAVTDPAGLDGVQPLVVNIYYGIPRCNYVLDGPLLEVDLSGLGGE